jgi:hypothetical protein
MPQRGGRMTLTNVAAAATSEARSQDDVSGLFSDHIGDLLPNKKHHHGHFTLEYAICDHTHLSEDSQDMY